MSEDYSRVLSVSCTKEFDVDCSTLWNLISTPTILRECHPFCESNEVLQWDEHANSDRLVYLNGLTYIRRFQTWSEECGYTLIIGEENRAQSYVIWEIDSLRESHSQLTITVYPFILARLPKPLAFFPHILWVRPRLKAYLKSVLSGFHYRIENNQPVPRNHFGQHPWFS